MKNLQELGISKSVEERAFNLVLNEDLDPIEAIKKALIQDTNFSIKIFEQADELAKEFKNKMFSNICKQLNIE